MHEFLPKPMFVKRELYNRMGDFLERVDALRDAIEDARHAENFEEFDNLMKDAWLHASGMYYKISDLHNIGKSQHYTEEKMKKRNGTLCRKE